MWRAVIVTYNFGLARIRGSLNLGQKDFIKFFRPLIFWKKHVSLLPSLPPCRTHLLDTCYGDWHWGYQEEQVQAHAFVQLTVQWGTEINVEISYSKLWCTLWWRGMPWVGRRGSDVEWGRKSFLIKSVFTLGLEGILQEGMEEQSV